jgi:hypothetical protein
MKWMTWLLLLANLAVAGFFVARERWPRAASEQTAPLNVDRLSLRGQSRAADAGKHAPSAPAAAKAASAEALCVEWRGLNPVEFVQAREQLKAMTAERVMSFAEVPVSTRHWVIFPPLPSPQSAAAKLAELAAAGVQDAFVVKEAAWRNAISLGLYANAETARQRVSEMESKGVLGTRIELLPRKGTDFYFVIRSDDPDALKSLDGIKQAYPNSQQQRLACPT